MSVCQALTGARGIWWQVLCLTGALYALVVKKDEAWSLPAFVVFVVSGDCISLWLGSLQATLVGKPASSPHVMHGMGHPQAISRFGLFMFDVAILQLFQVPTYLPYGLFLLAS